MRSAVVSNNLTHTKHSVTEFFNQLIPTLLDKDAKHLHIWSDGPSSQLKTNLLNHQYPG